MAFLKSHCSCILSRKVKFTVVFIFIDTLLLPAVTHALPKSAQVVHGNVSIDAQQHSLKITQSSAKAIVNWQEFDVAAHEGVTFKQPSANSVILNRVTGNHPSNIYGKLSANGNVFLVNTNGITFSANSQVNVGGFVGSTLDIKNADFLADELVFTANDNLGQIINRGHISAGTVALLGNAVINEGWIVASTIDTTENQPSVALVAANKVKLTFGDNKQLSVEISEGTINGLVANKTLIRADGGNVLLRAEALNEVFSASVNNTGVIEAHSMGMKNGRIVLLADMDTGVTTVDGTLDVSAMSKGKGGFIETSAATVEVKGSAIVLARGVDSENGLWLIDPSDLIIDHKNVAAFNASLNAGTNVSFNTVSNGSQSGNGDIFVYADIAWSADNTTLTLQAERNIEIRANISATGDNSGVILDTGLTYNGGTNWNKWVSDDNYALSNNIKYSPAGKIALSGADAVYIQDGREYRVINGKNSVLTGSTALAELQNIHTTWRRYALGVDIDTAFTPFSPIILSKVSFNGLNNSINNLTINQTSMSATGLFSKIDSSDKSYLRNLHLVGGKITGFYNVGSFVGRAKNLITSNISNSAEVKGVANASFNGNKVEFVGGIAGRLYSGNVLFDTKNFAKVTGQDRTGGIAGYTSESLLSKVSNEGEIIGKYKTGGLVGEFKGKGTIVKYSNNTGIVKGTASVGGLVGEITSMTNLRPRVTQSYNASSLVQASSGNAGGIVGKANRAEIDNVYVNGHIRSNGSAGGLIGTSAGSNLSAAYFKGKVTNYSGVKGSKSGAVVGQALAHPKVGGITYSRSNIDTVFYSSSVGNPPQYKRKFTDIVNVKSKSTSALKKSSTFSSSSKFQFGACGSSSVWCLIEGKALPGLNNARTTKYLDITSFTNAQKSYDQTILQTQFTHNSNDIAANEYIINTTSASIKTASSDAATYHANQLSIIGFDSSQIDVEVKQGNSLLISPYELTVDFSASNKTYDATTNAVITSTTLSSALSGDTVLVDFVGSGHFDNKNAGTDKWVDITGMTLKGAQARNYSVNINKTKADIAKAQINADLAFSDKVYDGTDAAAHQSTSFDNLFAGDDIAISIAGNAAFIDKNVATNKVVSVSGVSLSGVDSANYNLVSFNAVTADITAKVLGYTSSVANKVYDSGVTTSDLQGALSGVIAGDSIALDLSAATAVFVDKNVANNKIVNVTGAGLSGADSANYSFTTNSMSSASITPRFLNYTTSVANKVYDATTTASNLQGVLSGVFSGDISVLDLSTATALYVDKNVADNKIVNVTGAILTGADSANYSLLDSVTFADITPKALSYTSSVDHKIYDGDQRAANLQGTLNGVLVGDNTELDFASATGSFVDKNVGTAKVVDISGVVLRGTDKYNYSVAANSITAANITPKPLTLISSVADKIYDGNQSVKNLQGVLNGVVAGDGTFLDMSGAAALFSDKNVGIAKTVNITGLSLKGVGVSNYTLPAFGVTFASIAPASLQLTFNNSVVEYSGKSYSGGAGYSITGLIAGEGPNVINGDLVYAGSAQGAASAGEYFINGQGLSALNYELNFVPGILVIHKTPPPLQIDEVAADDAIKELINCDVVGVSGCLSNGDSITKMYTVLREKQQVSRAALPIKLINGGINLDLHERGPSL